MTTSYQEVILIEIEFVDYEKVSDFGLRLTKYINNNLKDAIRVLKDVLETDPDFEMDDLFPKAYLVRKPQECRNAVDELYEIICSDHIRSYIKPK